MKINHSSYVATTLTLGMLALLISGSAVLSYGSGDAAPGAGLAAGFMAAVQGNPMPMALGAAGVDGSFGYFQKQFIPEITTQRFFYGRSLNGFDFISLNGGKDLYVATDKSGKFFKKADPAKLMKDRNFYMANTMERQPLGVTPLVTSPNPVKPDLTPETKPAGLKPIDLSKASGQAMGPLLMEPGTPQQSLVVAPNNSTTGPLTVVSGPGKLGPTDYSPLLKKYGNVEGVRRALAAELAQMKKAGATPEQMAAAITRGKANLNNMIVSGAPALTGGPAAGDGNAATGPAGQGTPGNTQPTRTRIDGKNGERICDASGACHDVIYFKDHTEIIYYDAQGNPIKKYVYTVGKKHVKGQDDYAVTGYSSDNGKWKKTWDNQEKAPEQVRHRDPRRNPSGYKAAPAKMSGAEFKQHNVGGVAVDWPYMRGDVEVNGKKVSYKSADGGKTYFYDGPEESATSTPSKTFKAGAGKTYLDLVASGNTTGSGSHMYVTRGGKKLHYQQGSDGKYYLKGSDIENAYDPFDFMKR